jgi:hypothetical protein
MSLEEYADRYLEIAGTLLGRLPEQPGYPEEHIATVERSMELSFPPALREFYTSVGLISPLTVSFNQLRKPEECDLLGDKLIFWDESQFAVSWSVSIELPSSDPTVFQSADPDRSQWFEEHKSTAEFLCGMLVWEATSGGLPHVGAATLSSEPREQALGAWTKLEPLQELQPYYREGAALCILRSENELSVQAACRKEDGLVEIAKDLGVSWIPLTADPEGEAED